MGSQDYNDLGVEVEIYRLGCNFYLPVELATEDARRLQYLFAREGHFRPYELIEAGTQLIERVKTEVGDDWEVEIAPGRPVVLKVVNYDRELELPDEQIDAVVRICAEVLQLPRR
jgi:hypothetical protein